MKSLVPFIFSFFLCRELTAQKAIIDRDAIGNWATVGPTDAMISSDGRYVCYRISNQPPGTRKLVLHSTESGWKKEVPFATAPAFSADNRKAVFGIRKDTLGILSLGRDELNIIAGITEYAMSPDGRFLAWCLKGPKKEWVLKNLVTGVEQQFDGITQFRFSGDGNKCVLVRQPRKTGFPEISLLVIDLNKKSSYQVFNTSEPTATVGNFALSSSGEQIAFILGRNEGETVHYAIWYWELASDTARMLVDDKTLAIGDGFRIVNRVPEFSGSGKTIFFKTEDKAASVDMATSVQVDIWNHADASLYSIRQAEARRPDYYTMVYRLPENRVIRIEQTGERMFSRNEDFAFVKKECGLSGLYESHWNNAAKVAYYLVSLQDGTRRLLKDNLVNPHQGWGMSPGGRWLLYFNFEDSNYYSYEIATGITRNVTFNVNNNWLDEDNDRPEPALAWVPWLKTWLADDAAVLIKDSYDIWLVDPAGYKPPRNITKGAGRKNNIKFELLDDPERLNKLSASEANLLLAAFDKRSKDRGFFKAKLSSNTDPEPLSMGPYAYGQLPLKAAHANVYLVLRMNATEAPNYFVTKNFKVFKPLSDVQPHLSYNWYTTELHSWPSFNGQMLQGILYKPQNFDESLKYPVIFNYYERRSDELNLFIQPGASQNDINIPCFVSRGYLVFTPDIHYRVGDPGKSAYDAVASAAKYLSGFRFVDLTKMGLQGHSFGGYETNYIVTQTGIFAAACAASGIADLISWYGSGARGGFSIYHAERNQGRMGASIWEAPQKYITNSPIFYVDKVSTPLLLMNNKKDDSAPFSQGLEFFIALRRLGKKVWMLQYDQGGHSVSGNVAEDFHMRMTQFFDHYLKDTKAPDWMLER